ncbi:hypothetical protein [Paenibacillus tarimensis]|uniref:hypothetical protein n=1 Tax=Paenibacillus tarimensis TaxID=416012 RepID=UPI001F1E37B3|nr:hypothetical protein [Paenibacillus tarimensis]
MIQVSWCNEAAFKPVPAVYNMETLTNIGKAGDDIVHTGKSRTGGYMDCDQNGQECGVTPQETKALLEQYLEDETEMLRSYTILAERVHHDDELKTRLYNFAEGNAKRSKQLQEELQKYE